MLRKEFVNIYPSDSLLKDLPEIPTLAVRKFFCTGCSCLTVWSPLSSWISVLTNSKEEALNMAFRGEQSSGGEDGLEDLTKAIIEDVLRMPGNEVCCDCGAAGV